TSSFDKYMVEQASQQLKEFEGRVAISYLTDLPLKDILKTVSQLPPHSVILCATVFKDGAGQTFVPHEVVSLVSQVANAPVYGFLDQYRGRVIIGGHLSSVEAHGSKAAEVALRILRGEKATEIPISESTASIDMFDSRQLRHWGISERSLPAGSVVQFR